MMSDLERRFLESMANQHDRLRYPSGSGVRLSAIYVECRLPDEEPDDEAPFPRDAAEVEKFYSEGGTTEEYLRLYRADRARHQRRRTLHRALEEHCALFVVGDPGSGKTTFLSRVAWQAARARLARPRISGDTTEGEEPPAMPAGLPADALPVYVELAKLAKWCRDERRAADDGAVFEYAARQLAGRRRSAALERAVAEADQLLERAHAQGRMVWLLDGLDEVGEGERPGLRAAAERLADDPHVAVANRVVLTCREAATRAPDSSVNPGAPFARGAIVGLEGEVQADFAHKWVQAWLPDAGEAERQRRVGEILRAVQTQPGLIEAARNPLVLTHVCHLATEPAASRSTKPLPDTRAALYDAVLELLLRDDKRVGQHVWPGPTARVDPHQRRALLRDVVRRWASPSPLAEGELVPPVWQTQYAEPELVHYLASDERLGTDARARDFVQYLDQRAGVLRLDRYDTVDSAPRFGWGHRTFAEFLLAESLARSRCRDDASAETTLVARLLGGDADSWEHVARFYTAKLASQDGRPPLAAAFVARVLEQARRRRDGGKFAGAAALARLAAECVAECGEAAPAEARDAVDTWQAWMASPACGRASQAKDREGFWRAVGARDHRLAAATRWVHVPAGTYWRGAAASDRDAADDERRQGEPGAHRVFVNEFYVSRWPVTVGEYERFWSAGGYGDARWWGGEGSVGWRVLRGSNVSEPGDWARQRAFSNHPVVGVCWWEADAYCRWLGAQLEADASLRPCGLHDGWAGWSARLPWEAEWEKAARGVVDARRYPWGDELKASDANVSYGSLKQVAPVGCYPHASSPPAVSSEASAASAPGVWDMSGNVWEWCGDWYHPRAYDEPLAEQVTPRFDRRDDAPEVPVMRADGNRVAERSRVARGGGFRDRARGARVSYRGWVAPGRRSEDRGFRCVLVFGEDP